MCKKYVCPKCGSQLKVWQEYIFTKEAKVNPNTGKIYKTVTKTPIEENNDMAGFMCTNENCDFLINTINDVDMVKRYSWLNDINIEDL